MRNLIPVLLLVAGLLMAVTATAHAQDAGPTNVVAKKADQPSSFDQLKADYENLRKAFDAYRDKNDGRSDSRDLLALIVGALALLLTGGKTALRVWKQRRPPDGA